MQTRPSKKTARGILENKHFYNNIGRDFLALNNVNICSDKPNLKQTPRQPEESSIQTYLDLGTAPEIFRFYGRIEELNTLEKWIY